MKCLLVLLAVCHVILAAQDIDQFIVGGRDAWPGDYPHVVSFRYFVGVNHGCSGSILNTRWVLTAAHCISIPELPDVAFEMRMGLHNLSDPGVVYQVEMTVPHPRWQARNPINRDFYLNDIGLVRTTTPIEYVPRSIMPIPIRRESVAGQLEARVAGFGSTEMFPFKSETSDTPNSPFIQMSETLQELWVNVITNRNCNLRISTLRLHNEIRSYVMSSHICSFNRVGQGMCFGDSGSALISRGELIGVVSRGTLPCAQGFPDVYTRITSYLTWLDRYINWV